MSAACLHKLENTTTTDPDYPEPLEEYSDVAKVAEATEDSAGEEEEAEET